MPSSTHSKRIFLNEAKNNEASLHLNADDTNALQSASDAWVSAYEAHKAAWVAAQAATQRKDVARQDLESLIRQKGTKIQADITVSNELRTKLGLTIVDKVRTPAAKPTTRPIGTVDTSQRLQHTIHFRDERTPTSRAKPDGVRACQIFTKKGDPPPLDEKDLVYVASDSSTPYVLQFDGADVGKTAHYMLRWENTRGETGPWSETISAVIT